MALPVIRYAARYTAPWCSRNSASRAPGGLVSGSWSYAAACTPPALLSPSPMDTFLLEVYYRVRRNRGGGGGQIEPGVGETPHPSPGVDTPGWANPALRAAVAAPCILTTPPPPPTARSAPAAPPPPPPGCRTSSARPTCGPRRRGCRPPGSPSGGWRGPRCPTKGWSSRALRSTTLRGSARRDRTAPGDWPPPARRPPGRRPCAASTSRRRARSTPRRTAPGSERPTSSCPATSFAAGSSCQPRGQLLGGDRPITLFEPLLEELEGNLVTRGEAAGDPAAPAEAVPGGGCERQSRGHHSGSRQLHGHAQPLLVQGDEGEGLLPHLHRAVPPGKILMDLGEGDRDLPQAVFSVLHRHLLVLGFLVYYMETLHRFGSRKDRYAEGGSCGFPDGLGETDLQRERS